MDVPSILSTLLLLRHEAFQAHEMPDLSIHVQQYYVTSLPTTPFMLSLRLDFQSATESQSEDSINVLLEDFEYKAIVKDAEIVALEGTLQITLVPMTAYHFFQRRCSRRSNTQPREKA